MKGYELKMSGSRVSELLSRQFIVPTLSSPPTSSVLSWDDGGYIVPFRIGELCRVQENEGWKFYRLQDVKDNIAFWVNVNASESSDLSNYYTKEEVNDKIEERVSNITFPEDESIKNVTEEEYEIIKESGLLSDKTLYFVSKGSSPISLYIGNVLIAQREEGSKGFAYNFPIIF